MPRRVSLPGADELFRATGGPVSVHAADESDLEPNPAADAATVSPGRVGVTPAASRHSGPRRPSGRQKHDEKITVYVSPSELVDIEHARLTLRAEHALGVDRGRIVREALAVVLADLEAKGEDSILVRRLRANSNA